jgi:hypothetical protein
MQPRKHEQQLDDKDCIRVPTPRIFARGLKRRSDEDGDPELEDSQSAPDGHGGKTEPITWAD